MIALVAAAFAASPAEEAQLAELERVRSKVADQVHLSAFDLLDELVYGWVADPVFSNVTPVVLAQVTVPVGLGTGLQALVENHVSSVLSKNPTTNVQLVHCPSCTSVVVHSGPDATVVSRGIDDPKVIEALGAETGRHALFLDIEAEGQWLVLRARLTRLTPELPIVWSHTIASSTSTPAMLRESSPLKSADAARAEYLAALKDRGLISVPLRMAIRTYAQPGDDDGIPPPPFLWLQSGVELATTYDQAWTASLIAGYSFIPQAYQGIMTQGRVNRLISGRARSHTHPDLYVFVGAAAVSVWGPATASFRNDLLTADEFLIDAAQEPSTRTTFGALHTGFDVRLGNRMGFSTFLETMPTFNNSDNMGGYIRPFGLVFQSFGTEVTFWF